MKLEKMIILAFIIPISLIPLIASNRYIINVLDIIFIFIIYASAWNFFAYAGQASLGHAVFLGVGAYASMLLAGRMGFPPLITIIFGGITSTLMGLIVGLTCIRLREWFLSMVTFGFSVIVEVVVSNPLSWLTNGRYGLWAPRLIPSKIPNYYIYEYYIISSITIITTIVLYLLQKSKFGLALSAIRENETAAKATGVHATKYKLLALLVSSFFSGLAGALLAHAVWGGYVSPEIFSIHYSFNPIIYSVSGGLGTLEGPIIGTFLIIAIWEGLRFVGTYQRFIIIGAILITTVIFIPEGIAPAIKKHIKTLAGPPGFEPGTSGSEGRCSIQAELRALNKIHKTINIYSCNSARSKNK